MWARTGLPVGGEEVWEQEVDGGGRAGGARLLAVPPSWPLLPCPDHSQGSAWPMLRSSVGVQLPVEEVRAVSSHSRGLRWCW